MLIEAKKWLLHNVCQKKKTSKEERERERVVRGEENREKREMFATFEINN